MLHQLLMTPIFGVETVDSLKVEQDRARYRALQAQEKRTRGEQREFTQLRTELESLPDWSTESPSEARQRELLEQIDVALALANGTATNGRRAPTSAATPASATPASAAPAPRALAARPRRAASPLPPEPTPRENLGDGRGALVRLS
jgi:hypothetical protein